MLTVTPSPSRLGNDGRGRCLAATWSGMRAEVMHIPSREPHGFHFRGPVHLLCVNEYGYRVDGETRVDDLRASRRRALDNAMVFVPRGAELSGWSRLKSGSSWIYLYLEPELLSFDADFQPAGAALRPRLFFDDPTISSTAIKIKRLIERPGRHDELYAQTLGSLLAIELVRLFAGVPHPPAPAAGGLSPRCERILCDYMHEHLADHIRLNDLAKLVDLSPYHLSRAFKKSVGVPPHDYLVRCRVERAKQLLAETDRSITDVALAAGFGGSSHFSVVFRKLTGFTPSLYRRAVAPWRHSPAAKDHKISND
jgi:AraC family transcriptional regulator